MKILNVGFGNAVAAQRVVAVISAEAAPTKRMIQAAKASGQGTTVKAKTGMLTRTVPTECDVRGMSLEEALSAVGLYLDEAVLVGLNEVYIIHGKGTGILRAGIQQDLRKNRHVKSFRRGVYGEGEDGVTVVTLR